MMVLQLSLSSELEDRLRQEAQRRGVSLDAVTVQLLERYLPRDNHVAPAEIRRHDALPSGSAPRDERLYDDSRLLVQEGRAQHDATVAAWRAVCERLGIVGQAIGAKQFRERLVAGGVNPDGNAFSRELISMREE